MKVKSINYKHYHPYPGVDLKDRTWPDERIIKAPIWCSVDLRDGNQALNTPMNIDQKIRMFDMLVEIGFKEIEVGFPSASQIEYDFVRKLIEENRIPEDVAIQVLTQAREHLIKRTFDSLHGVRQAIVHVYNSTSVTQRRVVFQKSKAEVMNIAVNAAESMSQKRAEMKDSSFRFEYSPESFTGTELEYALDISHAVLDVWHPNEENPVIINLPATVEMSTPNIYADRIEWFSRHIRYRKDVILSVHTHNDRGTAVAAGELAVMAGADRVEGSIFGNGERTGNMDLVTMGMNLFCQGVDPELDFSNIGRIRDIYSECTGMVVPERQPYAGDLVFTAFSGSHQDAIHKGLKAQKVSKEDSWDVPYLPIDPRDVGRDYESIIRINSQSGKGGVAYVLDTEFGFQIPKPMQTEVARIVQKKSELTGKELSSQDIFACFESEFLMSSGTYQLVSCTVQTGKEAAQKTMVEVCIETQTGRFIKQGEGNGPLDAFVHALEQMFNRSINIALYSEHALSGGSDAQAVAYVGISIESSQQAFGIGIDTNISRASFKAVISAMNRFQN